MEETCQFCQYLLEMDDVYKKSDLKWKFPDDYECAFEHVQYPGRCDEFIENDFE